MIRWGGGLLDVFPNVVQIAHTHIGTTVRDHQAGARHAKPLGCLGEDLHQSNGTGKRLGPRVEATFFEHLSGNEPPIVGILIGVVLDEAVVRGHYSGTRCPLVGPGCHHVLVPKIFLVGEVIEQSAVFAPEEGVEGVQQRRVFLAYSPGVRKGIAHREEPTHVVPPGEFDGKNVAIGHGQVILAGGHQFDDLFRLQIFRRRQ